MDKLELKALGKINLGLNVLAAAAAAASAIDPGPQMP